MKLIIDIPEVDYECAKQRWMRGNSAHMMDYYISKGISFDDVKAGARENVHGEWIEQAGSIIYCSECLVEALEKYDKQIKSNFCPNCGASMKGEPDGKNI